MNIGYYNSACSWWSYKFIPYLSKQIAQNINLIGETPKEGYYESREIIPSGKALQKLEEWIRDQNVDPVRWLGQGRCF